VAGSLSEAERIDALAEPEAKWDQDIYGMKRAGMRPREQDSDPRQGLALRWRIGIRGGGLDLRRLTRGYRQSRSCY
jgi:hypothetical protein